MAILDTIVGLAPVAVLVVMTIMGVRTSVSLPVATVLLWFISLIYFKYEANFVNATVVRGVGEAATPIAIVFGAIALFESMKLTPVLSWTRYTLKRFSRGNKIGEMFLIAWAFSYLIEGCSGFGTPTALSAPLLVELGYDPLEAVVTCLIMNTLATPFGAAGTPIWFGFEGIGLDDDDFITIGFWAQVVCLTAAHVIPFVAVWPAFAAVRPKSDLPRELLISLACVYSCSLTALIISYFSAELPTLLGGFIGLLLSGYIVKRTSEGKPVPELEEDEEPEDSQQVEENQFEKEEVKLETSSSSIEMEEVNVEASPASIELGGGGEETRTAAAQSTRFSSRRWSSSSMRQYPLWKFAFPISMVVFFLTLTRAPYLDLKDELRSGKPRFNVRLGSFGKFYISSALVVGLEDIFREDVSTSFEFLYNPAILPFFVVSLLTLVVFDDFGKVGKLLKTTWGRTRSVLIPITAALIFAQLMRAGVSEEIAKPLVSAIGKVGWTLITPLFGALGSFFSGSTTVSNLTFGDIQIFAAERLDLNKLKLLSLQTVGATLGNCICLQNIISAKTVVGLDTLESVIIGKTAKCAAIFVLISWVWGIIYIYL